MYPNGSSDSTDASLNRAGIFIYLQKGISIMSDITAYRPEVVNENTDVICSTSVRYRSLEYDNFPEISEANILSTFVSVQQEPY